MMGTLFFETLGHEKLGKDREEEKRKRGRVRYARLFLNWGLEALQG